MILRIVATKENEKMVLLESYKTTKEYLGDDTIGDSGFLLYDTILNMNIPTKKNHDFSSWYEPKLKEVWTYIFYIDTTKYCQDRVNDIHKDLFGIISDVLAIERDNKITMVLA